MDFYTKDAEIQYYMSRLLNLYVFFEVFDFLQMGQSGIVKAIGKAKWGFYAFVFAYYILGIPLSVIFGYGADMQIIGFWLGFFLGIVAIFCI